jgi:hypothetical protein
MDLCWSSPCFGVIGCELVRDLTSDCLCNTLPPLLSMAPERHGGRLWRSGICGDADLRTRIWEAVDAREAFVAVVLVESSLRVVQNFRVLDEGCCCCSRPVSQRQSAIQTLSVVLLSQPVARIHLVRIGAGDVLCTLYAGLDWFSVPLAHSQLTLLLLVLA